MVTIKDLAREANVSVATISMALNGKEGISKETKERIIKLAEEMNYVPSTIAQALKTQSTRNIGVIVGQLTNAYSMDIIDAAEEIANEHDYNIFVSSTGLDIEKTLQVLRRYHKYMVDGIILSIPIVPDKAFMKEINRLKASGVVVIALVKTFKDCGIPVISFKEHKQVTHYLDELVRLGHKHIGLIEGRKGSPINYDRPQIFKDALVGHRLYSEDYIKCCKVDMFDAKKKAIELLQEYPQITAIYAINDMLAIGVLQAASELGIKVPEELSILGTDGVQYVSFTIPNITTVITPRREIGRIGMIKVLQLIEKKDVTNTENITIPCDYFEGATIAPARI